MQTKRKGDANRKTLFAIVLIIIMTQISCAPRSCVDGKNSSSADVLIHAEYVPSSGSKVYVGADRVFHANQEDRILDACIYNPIGMKIVVSDPLTRKVIRTHIVSADDSSGDQRFRFIYNN